jgi:hypothetical protein
MTQEDLIKAAGVNVARFFEFTGIKPTLEASSILTVEMVNFLVANWNWHTEGCLGNSRCVECGELNPLINIKSVKQPDGRNKTEQEDAKKDI